MNQTSGEWNARYGEGEQIWSGEPNSLLVRELSGVTAARIVDVGCGEGADAIWLARRGWQVVAVDVSGVAIERAKSNEAKQPISQTGLSVDWRLGAFEHLPIDEPGFDVVSAFYPSLHKADGTALARLLGAVRPGGTLIFVHHAQIDRERALERGYDPADYLSDTDVAAALGRGWRVEAHDVLEGDIRGGAGAHHRHDVLLRARRR